MYLLNLSTNGKKIEVYLRCREHACSKDKQMSGEHGASVKSIAETPQEATSQSCLRGMQDGDQESKA